jgi:hypothetical protein
LTLPSAQPARAPAPAEGRALLCIRLFNRGWIVHSQRPVPVESTQTSTHRREGTDIRTLTWCGAARAGSRQDRRQSVGNQIGDDLSASAHRLRWEVGRAGKAADSSARALCSLGQKMVQIHSFYTCIRLVLAPPTAGHRNANLWGVGCFPLAIAQVEVFP